jgi:hypothetical protein
MAANSLTQTVSTISTGRAFCPPATTSSKRTFLRGAAAVAAAAIPAGAAVASGPNPDAALLALQPEIDAADVAWEARAQQRSAAEHAYFALGPDKPEEPRTPKAVMDAFWDGDSRPLIEASKSPATDYAEAFKAWRRATEQAHDDTGLTAAEKAQNAADDVRIAICNEKIIPTRATALAGLIFKARYAASHFPGDPDEDVMRSIVDDLLAMAGEVV